MPEAIRLLTCSDGSKLAYEHLPGAEPGVLFCPGFHSNMQGLKALELRQWAVGQGRQYTRFDYYGHGDSSGEFEQGSIGRWLADTVEVFDRVTQGSQVVVGSSMGGWIMLLLAQLRPERIAGLLGIAAAPDFTERLRRRLSAEQQLELAERGYVDLPTQYDDGTPYRITRRLLQEAVEHLLLDTGMAVDAPLRLIHGQCDESVPWEVSMQIAAGVRGENVELLLVKHGDHRLSEPNDLQRMLLTLERLLAEV
ncbi:MAG: alpha/beta hydrolase [Pseudomonadota bacterium]